MKKKKTLKHTIHHQTHLLARQESAALVAAFLIIASLKRLARCTRCAGLNSEALVGRAIHTSECVSRDNGKALAGRNKTELAEASLALLQLQALVGAAGALDGLCWLSG